eukprot:TRINITY_DN9084_c0_g1_i1.p1 TRINITY_DN9084_c0_g1~~TRINITY_DN9084_c0_g1_i1.p1  ORF type:complete len:167 (-),score=1.25 TRINITY_DN9084_c0_g1_i1:176-676(-)
MTDQPYFFPPGSSQTSRTYPALYIPIVLLSLLVLYTVVIAVILLVKKFLLFYKCCYCNDGITRPYIPSCLEGLRYFAERCNLDIPSPSNFIDQRFRVIIAACNCCSCLRSISGALKDLKDSVLNLCQCCNNCGMCHYPECNCTCNKPECNEINCGCFSINFRQYSY